MRASGPGPVARGVVARRIGAAVVYLAVLGTSAWPVGAQPWLPSGDRTAARAEVATAPAEGRARGEPLIGQPSRPPRRPWTTPLHALPTSAVHRVDLAHPGTALFGDVAESSSPADYAPVTGTVKGRVGDTVVIRLGVRNLSPDPTGSSEPSDGGATGTFAVVPPPGTTVTSIPWEGDDDDRRYSCRLPQDKDNYFFLCDGAPLPGSSVTIGFHIRIDKRIPGAKGSVTAYSPNDPVPGNDRAAIPVEAAPAPLWRWQNPLWRWQHWALAAGVLAFAAPTGRWLARRRRPTTPH